MYDNTELAHVPFPFTDIKNKNNNNTDDDNDNHNDDRKAYNNLQMEHSEHAWKC